MLELVPSAQCPRAAPLGGGVFDEAGVQTLLIVAEVFAAQEDGNLFGQMITSVATPSERRSY